MSDDQIALAMELRYGLNQPWKVVAKIMGMHYQQLRLRVWRAKYRGMRDVKAA